MSNLGTQSPRVLIVDDNEDTADFLSSLLGTRGMLCDTAGGVREAVTKFNIACDAGMPCYDAIIMDVDLPSVSGISLLKVIRGVHPDIPAFVVTAYVYDSALVIARTKQLRAKLFEKPLLDPVAFMNEVVETATNYFKTKPTDAHARLILPEIVEQIIARARGAANGDRLAVA